ncbi:DUF2802 domain-containing protein [Shewanella sp. OPT22]|uniref:DUF2802 domain-containing protein n=1 Tax=Parashewanella hymeniacidonis TaxID=2807618 RepID=UPI00102259AC|nr:DUF2802 domain-containing protein [Parashewanella hymeniacidonis]MBM7072083.1 DUF2802 domain-containing protein [Parashewanella hymeniacidonis]RYV02610.1 DUF2802 domain-containing protein [Shewanella sp. OPT22]
MGNELLIAALFYATACLGLVLYLQKQIGKQRSKVDALTTLVKDTEKQRDIFKKELQELRNGTIGVGRRVIELEKKLKQYEARLDEAEQEEPQSRMYTRAMKMVSLGADIKEIVAECELPRAEAELLIRLHGAKQEA